MYNLKTTKTNVFRKFEFRPYSERNFDQLVSKIEQINWDAVICSTDVGVSFRAFIYLINGLYTKCFPLKITFLSEKRLSKPWLTPFIICQIKLKSTYFKHFKNGLISKSANNHLKNKVNKLVAD